jgi:uncharacterized coiled-coil protein SlyX
MPHNTLTSDDWVTRDDMAVLSRKSTATLRRDVQDHSLETRVDGAGRVLVSVGEFLRIGRLRQEDLTAGASPVESVEVLRARETITVLRVQVGELTGRLAHADALVAALSDQLSQKDKQLAKNADHLGQLIGRLGAFGGAA